MSRILEILQGGLIVSCQPVPGGPMDRPETVAAFALAAIEGGAVGLRIEGVANLRAVRAATSAPIIGLVKRDLADSPVRITPWLQDITELAEAGADIIAFDATDRPRPVSREDLAAAIRSAGCLAMADCASIEDGLAVQAMGAEILGSTMSGYVSGPVPALPDLDLVAALAATGKFVIAEGRYHMPSQAADAIGHGADAVVVGSAITRTEHVTDWFAKAIQSRRSKPVKPQAVLAVDLGGSKILAAIVQGGQVLDRAEVPTQRSSEPMTWLDQVRTLCLPWAGRFDRMGMAVTGLVADGKWRALNAATLNVPEGFPLMEEAKAMFDVPVVAVNDAQAAAWGEYVFGAGDGKDMVFLTVSTGIGGGVVAGGRLLSGRNGLAGHFGQLLSPAQGKAQRLEDGASGLWMAQEAARLGLAPDARAIFAEAAGGNAAAQDVIAVSASRVAGLCGDLQLMFDPARIVIGGGLGLAPGYLDLVVRALAHLDPVLRPELVSARLGRDAGIVGVADLARNKLQPREKVK